MKQEDKDLLLKDLCARLPYGVKVKIEYYDYAWNICSINPNGVTFVTKYTGYPIETNWENCKPYLFPLSSMSERQCYELSSIRSSFQDCWKYIKTPIPLSICNFEQIEWLHKNHFDYRGLIEKGLAIDATGLNIY
jgi:hypothetical protein